MKKIEQTRAKIKYDQFCLSVEEPLVFYLKDSVHKFSIDLSVILRCLAILEATPFISEIPKSWWKELEENYLFDFQVNLPSKDSVSTQLYCDKCIDPVVFLMEDHVCDFYMSLTTVMQCLAHAERMEYLPQLPSIFWQGIVGKYNFEVKPKHYC